MQNMSEICWKNFTQPKGKSTELTSLHLISIIDGRKSEREKKDKDKLQLANGTHVVFDLGPSCTNTECN